jgi:tetratricopeptide (TPR) repeat protein
MSLPELNQLTRAEQLFDEGKLAKALEILNDQSQFEGLNQQQESYYHFLKGLILMHQLNSEGVIKLGEQLFKEGQNINDNLQSFDGLFFILIGLCIADNFDEAIKLIGKAEDLLKNISDFPKYIFLIRKVRINLLKAWSNMFIGNIDLAERCLELVFGLQKELGNVFEIAWANILKGQIFLFTKSNLNLAINYFKNVISLAMGIKFNHAWIAMSHEFIAIIYQMIGELDNSLKHHIKALKLVKEFKSNVWDGRLLNNMANTYSEKGEYDLALQYLERSLKIYKTPRDIAGRLDSLIYVALEKGDPELAQKYFHLMEDIYNQRKESHVELLYNFNKALILKISSRIRDRAKAEELLKHVIETKTMDFGLTINAYIHLCDLLLSEFRINNNPEVLDEINQNIAKLLSIAENTNSYRFFCETFILKAKLALLNLDFKEARRFLTQAQKIAEKYGIKRLAMKISYEHDELLRKSKIWENVKKSEIPFAERWNLSGLNKQMEDMLRKRIIEPPKILEEEPVSIFIITEGGLALFSHSFIDDKSFESHLFGGFLTTIDFFIREMFSEGLDRAIFGEYTLIMKSIPPFFISYIFKGDSYRALQKITQFIDHIQKEESIWQKLLKYFQKNQSLHLKDIPLLESLISEIFTTKSIVYSEL